MAASSKKLRRYELATISGARFARAIGIDAAEHVRLAVAVHHLPVLVALVARDDDDRKGRRTLPCELEEVTQAEHVDLERLERAFVALFHDRLSGQVKHDVGVAALPDLTQAVSIADVALVMVETVRELEHGEEIRLGGWGARETRHVRADSGEPGREPTALESGVAGDEDLSIAEAREGSLQCVHYFQTAQGASSFAHMSCTRR